MPMSRALHESQVVLIHIQYFAIHEFHPIGGVEVRDFDEDDIMFLKFEVMGVCRIIESAVVKYGTNPPQNQ